MLKVKKWTESDYDFREIARIQNLVNHDSIDHPDDLKQKWLNRHKTVLAEKYFLSENEINTGILHFSQGSKANNQNGYFDICLDPDFQTYSNYKLLYDQLLKRVKKFNCNRLFPWCYLHDNYKKYIEFLEQEGFDIVMKHREYKLNVEECDLSSFNGLEEKMKTEKIQMYDSRNEMQDFPDHYKKLEALVWKYIQDEPMMDGDSHVRKSYDRWLEKRNEFEKHSYGVEMVAVKNGEYIGSTRVKINKKSEPERGYTESTGVLKQFRRQGIATALKVESIKKLKAKGIKEIRTGNEINNPMYKINEKLGFELMEQSLEFRKEI
ncbi:MAG: GNAT family N-acetyltransferase [Candidatus Marinimicrobia bacterium]|jgi:GNAT superfamily N-acetyltransferase|nr:GNAT family N-acetyltransferase [Candidatus Neomarinimicrobiota bacterium]